MKLRIKGNTLRYRLTQTDIAHLAKEGFVKEKVEFGDDTLVYVLQSTKEDSLSADLKNNIVTVYLPDRMVNELTTTDKVGFSGEAGKLSLLIEKDFTCLEDVNEDQSDNYPNPLLADRKK